ncbi:AAA domain-containing protein [Brevibacterium siliguriense]|uniref:AAA domain-containing protein n=1 Tax=Brevibacterium siliguriense TaxID=1136497 RepID=A0A1H1RBC0_9MICO|nr:AAA family ATPase [Brevibacterium siliguriense]SDS33012.1 AAA domain-containing protein [Brevibacterium siliguriense]
MEETLKLRRTSELPPAKHPQWLGIGWIPKAEITVLVGPEGIGKSLLWVRVAAAVTTGRPLPEMRIPKRAPATVVVIVSEDGRGEVEERLKLAGADLENILWFGPEEDGTGAPTFARNQGGVPMQNLADGVRELEQAPALLVVDAWLDTVDGGIQVKDGQQARAALAPWKRFATNFGTAVMLLTHTNRIQGASTRDRMGATAVLRQKARMTLFADRPEEDFDNIYVGPDKANNTGISNAVKYTKNVVQVRPRTEEDQGTTAQLLYPSDVGQTIHAEIASWEEQQRQANKKPSKAEEVAEEIKRLMESRGINVMPVADLDRHLKAMGFGDTAIRNGKKIAGDSSLEDRAGGGWKFHADPSFVNSSISLTSNETNETNETELSLNAWCGNCGDAYHFEGSELCEKCETHK